jgi:hypothetical protein
VGAVLSPAQKGTSLLNPAKPSSGSSNSVAHGAGRYDQPHGRPRVVPLALFISLEASTTSNICCRPARPPIIRRRAGKSAYHSWVSIQLCRITGSAASFLLMGEPLRFQLLPNRGFVRKKRGEKRLLIPKSGAVGRASSLPSHKSSGQRLPSVTHVSTVIAMYLQLRCPSRS